MNRHLRNGAILVAVLCLGLALSWRSSEALAQKSKPEVEWEYKTSVFSYNPGERMSDDQRARIFEKGINEEARKGWELVGTVMSRDTTQTVGGSVTTRDTVSFVAYRRAKR